MSTLVRLQVRLVTALLIALWIASVPATLRAQSPRIRAELDTAFVSVGGRIEFTVWVEHDPAASVVWPDSLDLGPVEVLGAEILPPANEGGRSVSGARFTLRRGGLPFAKQLRGRQQIGRSRPTRRTTLDQ